MLRSPWWWWWWWCGSSLEGSPLPQGLCLHQSRDREARTVGSNLIKSWDADPRGCFFPPSFSTDGTVRSKGNVLPSPRWVVVKGGGVFSLLTLEDQAAEHQGGSQDLQNHDQDPHVDGHRHEGSRIPGSSGQFPQRSPRLVWHHRPPCAAMWGDGGCPGNAGEPSGLGKREPASSWGPRACAIPAHWELGWLSPSRLSHVGQEGSRGQTLETTTVPFTSSGPGHWRTPSRTARAWGLAAWGPG